MELILSHNNMDFDSLASQYALSRLYPTARMLPGYPLVGNVRRFLSLYRDSLPISQLKYIDWNHVDRIFIVDCQHADRLDESVRARLSGPGRTVPYTIFDHHQMDPKGLGPGAEPDSIISPVGSTTTLLTEILRKKKVRLTPFDATLLLIGIYEDTGCLTYSGTTAADAEASAHLLANGADLNRVNEFLHARMSEEQVRLLEDLVRSSSRLELGGLQIVIATASLPGYLDGLATLTRKLLEIESVDAAISVVKMRDRVHLVGRSDSPAVDVRTLLREFGGDGHPGAASAVARGTSVAAAAERLESMLREHVRPEKTAADVMTQPVRTIRARTTMEEALRLMLRYGQDGLVVTEGEEVVGIVSRRDIDQATHHKLGHAPVQGFMSRPVLTIAPETPLSEIQRVMIKEDVGRLPVVTAGGRLVGLVGRRELLASLYGQAGGEREPDTEFQPATVDIRQRLDSLAEPTRWLFAQAGKMAARQNMVIYAVGGCVRDLFLSVPNFDLDFVVEGSAIELASALEAAYPARLQVVARHERFQTATLVFHEARKREVDISTARTEFYEFPAALPTVEASGLQQDLYRRDFTINALAVCLNPGRYGELVDYFGGLRDLKERKIRILHPFSFIEDPTRIVRAARFASRLGFDIERRTGQRAERAIAMGIFDGLGGVRMRTELRLILESPERLRGLELLGQFGGRLRFLDPELEYGARERQLIRRAERLISRYPLADEWIVHLGILVSRLDPARLSALLDRLHLSNEQKAQITAGLGLAERLAEQPADLRRSQIFALLNGQENHCLAIAAVLSPAGSAARRMIRLYLEELRDVRVTISGADLLAMGVPEGPLVGSIMSMLSSAKLDGLVKSDAEELAFVRERVASLPAGTCSGGAGGESVSEGVP